MNKKITIDVVHIVAAMQIIKNGKTTTLEIKNELRSMAFFATQDEISKIMDSLTSVYKDNNIFWNVDDKKVTLKYKTVNIKIKNQLGSFREYYFEDVDAKKEVPEPKNETNKPDEDCLICEDLVTCYPEYSKTSVVRTPARTLTLRDAIIQILDNNPTMKSVDILKLVEAKGFSSTESQIRAYKAHYNR